jgi:transposase
VDIKLNGGVDGARKGSTYRRIEVITGEVRRRRWTAAEKAAILAETLEPGARFADVARRHGVNRNLLGTWRRRAREGVEAAPTFVPLQIRDEAAVATTPSPAKEEEAGLGVGRHLQVGASGPQTGTIDIETDGVRVRVSGAADLPALRQVLAYLGRRP